LLDPAQKKKYEQNQDNEPKSAAWEVTPASAVRPSGQCAHENKNQDNQQYRSDIHFIFPSSLPEFQGGQGPQL